MIHKLNGIPAANGYAIGKAYELIEPDLSFEAYTIGSVNKEIDRMYRALKTTKKELLQIRQKVLQEQGEENAKIFDACILVLEDPELITPIEILIKHEKINVEQALDIETNKFIAIFELMDNVYMKERASDIKDVKKRILSHLLQKPLPDLGFVNEPTIIVALDLTPSDTAQINKRFIKGFITDVGGHTTHTAIMARSMEIPAIVGVRKATSSIKHGNELIIDGMKGDIIINPTAEMKEKYKVLNIKYEKQRSEWALLKDKPSITSDNQAVKLAANIGSPQDIDSVMEYGAEGVGLYRTEFLYMKSNDFPKEDEQVAIYKSVLEAMRDKPVIIRTLDIGGDKKLNYWSLPDEMNPFLGLRAIRISLKHKDVFRTQLRALLRASKYGNLKIMFPMIATIEEFHTAQKLLLEEKVKLQKEGVEISDSFEVGITVEIPSTAIIAKQFAKEVDFFSIGSNDLIQYTFAADRENENVSYLYQPYHPAILHLVKTIIDAAIKENKWVGMCGEMAGDPIAIPLLVGLGLNEFSMTPSSILPARSQIKQLNKKKMQQLAIEALDKNTSEEVRALVNSFTSG